MPGKIKVKILAGRNLPVMDRSGDTTDAYVEIKFSNTTYKTDVCRKSLNPQWNSEWYRFEVDDAELQDEPLQIRLMDHDTYSANDAIGKVYINLNPLLLPGSPLAVKNIWTLEATMNSSSGAQGGSVMTGWIPVFDTMHGIRGEVNIIVKVELFSDCNKFRQSSCGVQFFYSPNIPHGYHAQVIHGFVEELVVSDDPEYKWIDKIRTPRASNEARQTLFFKLSGEVQRKIGLKALDLGGNAVIGYVQNFDHEGESGIVARGIGTAVTLVKLQDVTAFPLESSNIEDLTCFALQSKMSPPLECSESDDSLPLLSHSPTQNPIPRSPIKLGPTAMSQKFPRCERSSQRQHRQSMRIVEYRAAGMRSRQLSLQSNSSVNPLRKGTGSSLSLADDLINESGLKNMLALEDMRGEPAGNPFSRGLKNFRYLHQNILPKRVAQIKSRLVDSFDDESDPDSNYSSAWSLAGSESTRSSIADLRHSMRRKKFTHKKASSDGIAALLIRSVHTNFPLDSVIEDRETPAPSPVNFLTDTTDYSDDQRHPSNEKLAIVGKSEIPESRKSAEKFGDNSKIVLGKKKRGPKYPSEMAIPMISSSETDTSTSDDEDDDDDPSESSTNYNILDETYSLIEANSPDDRIYRPRYEGLSKLLKTPEASINEAEKSLEKSIDKECAFDKSEDAEIPENDDKPRFSQSQRDRSLESSTDYNILDDNSSLRESNLSEDAKFGLKRNPRSEKKVRSLEEKGNLDISDKRRFSSLPETNSTDNCAIDDTLLESNLSNEKNVPTDFREYYDNPSKIQSISGLGLSAPEYSVSEICNDPKIGDFGTEIGERSRRDSESTGFGKKLALIAQDDIPEAVDTVTLLLSSALEQIDKSLVKIEDYEKTSIRDNVLPHDFYFGTDDNVLGDIYPLVEPSGSVNETNRSKIYQHSREDSFPDGREMEKHKRKNIFQSTKEIAKIDESVPAENSRFHPDVCSHSSTDYNVLEEIDVSIEGVDPLDSQNFDHNFRRNLGHDNVPDIAMNWQKNSFDNRISKSLEEIPIVENVQEQINLSLLSVHEILDSSTDYNVLDDSCSLIEASSLSEDNFNAIFQKTAESLDGAKTFDRDENVITSVTALQLLQEIGERDNKSTLTKKLPFPAESDVNLDSSTDYNILEDVSLSEPSLASEGILDTFVDPMENRYFPEIPANNPIFTSSLGKFEKSAGRAKNLEIESPMIENFRAPFSTKHDKFSNEREKQSDDSIPKLSLKISPSSSYSRLKHLKFLPKQENFDKPEDADGFVTSTPVETDVACPDFLPNDDSPSIHEKKKYDFQGFHMREKSENKILSADSIDSPLDVSTENTGDSESFSPTKELQICPLGVPFEKSSIANELKIPNDSKILSRTATEEKSQSFEKFQEMKDPPRVTAEKVAEKVIPVPRSASIKKKVSKKVERTDTVIYKGPPKDRERFVNSTTNADSIGKTDGGKKSHGKTSPIPIIVAPPPEEHATRLQVPVIQTTNINVQSTFSPDEMKTQHFGSIGSRKFPVDEFAISERFNRKYRQHCMHDLMKTITTKMMTHHGHHERRDSTRSKQRKMQRDRGNASATPSPVSIHRIRQHKRRSRSKSPEKHPHSRAQNTGGPASHASRPKIPSIANLCQEQTCHDSNENLSRTSSVSVPPRDPTSKDTMASSDEKILQDRPHLPELSGTPADPITDLSPSSPIANARKNHEKSDLKILQSSLQAKDPIIPVGKSHSAGNLDFTHQSSSRTTKNTNNANTIDDLCVACSVLTPRQNDEQPSSPVPQPPPPPSPPPSPPPPPPPPPPSSSTSTVLPSSLGFKVPPNSSTTTKNPIPNLHRRSSDSDLSITPKGNSLAGSDRSMGGHLRPSTAIVRTMNQDTMEMLEYPFITMQQYPPGFILNIGGLVSARSVKLLERITNLEEPEGRDAWWTEIRMEVRSHARALACNVVLGYKEEISICDDVCVLNASGTAAVINLLNTSQDQDNVLLSRTLMTTSVESEREKSQGKSASGKSERNEEMTNSGSGQQNHPGGKMKRTSESNDHEIPYLPSLSACSLCHLPYNEASVPFRVDVSKCSICRRSKVPDVLFTTIELPENVPMTGRGVFLQATICKCKRDLRGELNAKEISDCLPFLEYELHSLLLNKLKVKGMNAIFGLKVQVSVGERLVIGMGVGTAVYLTALPMPSVPKIASGNSWHNEEQLAEIRKTLVETVKKNREFYRLKPIVDVENGRSVTTSDTDESDEDLPDMDLSVGTKDACVLEVDDVEDMDRINSLIDEKPPDDFHVVNTQTIPGLEDLEIVRNLQMFTQISRAKIPAGQFASMPSKYFARMVQTVLFKLRRMVPCALCDMQFKVALPEQDEIQLSVVGMALGLGDPTRFNKYKRKVMPNSVSKDPVKKTDEADLIFSLDEDPFDNTTGLQETLANQTATNMPNSSPIIGHSAQKHRPRSPFRTKSHMSHKPKHVPLKERYGVDITPLSYLPGGKIERYLGNLNFFFIRESTSIRENGGLSGFTHSFVTEILAIVRAHITALGGNAMVAFFMTQCVLLHTPHKNQGQCLINVGGDVVAVSYYGDDKHQGNQNC